MNIFNPDVVHLNNFNFHITPSIIYEIKKYQGENKRKLKIVYTAHDFQLVCPNHMMNNPITRKNCERCINGKFANCIRGKCIHGSIFRSTIGAMEGYLYNILKTYKYIDVIICPSQFLESKIRTNPLFEDKTIVLRNFIDEIDRESVQKEDYVLYFGRFSHEKGIMTLINVCEKLPNILFIFAGTGPLESKIASVKNIKNVGYQTGKSLKMLIQKARFSIYPSEWYENCPFSVIESLMYETPVLGANIGGIPELIEIGKTGELFKSADADALLQKIEMLWNDKEKTIDYAKHCRDIKFDTIRDYCVKLINIYQR